MLYSALLWAPSFNSFLFDLLMCFCQLQEMLYPSLREILDKYPAWLEANRDKTSAEDCKRYEEQIKVRLWILNYSFKWG